MEWNRKRSLQSNTKICLSGIHIAMETDIETKSHIYVLIVSYRILWTLGTHQITRQIGDTTADVFM